MITEQNDIIARAALTGLEQPEFIREVLLPLLGIEGVEVRFCNVPTIRVPHPKVFADFGNDLIRQLTTKPGIEIVIGTHEGLVVMAAVGNWLAKMNPEVIGRVVKNDARTLWFRFDEGADDIRKITVLDYDDNQFLGVSPNLLYVNRSCPAVVENE
jgi:hypothetical protein